MFLDVAFLFVVGFGQLLVHISVALGVEVGIYFAYGADGVVTADAVLRVGADKVIRGKCPLPQFVSLTIVDQLK